MLGSAPQDVVVCSAKACRNAAAYGLLWNNPTLHSPDRRKTWLACGDHLASLTEFLSLRGFLRETVPVAELPGQLRAGAEATEPSAADR